MNELNDLEAAVLDKLLAGDDLALALLREQWRLLCVGKREYSGVGFFTEFELPPGTPRLPISTPIRFGDVLAEVDGMEQGAGFVLFIDNGLLTMLEGYSNANEDWPEAISSFRLRYWGLQRDLSAFSVRTKGTSG